MFGIAWAPSLGNAVYLHMAIAVVHSVIHALVVLLVLIWLRQLAGRCARTALRTFVHVAIYALVVAVLLSVAVSVWLAIEMYLNASTPVWPARWEVALLIYLALAYGQMLGVGIVYGLVGRGVLAARAPRTPGPNAAPAGGGDSPAT